MYRAVIGILFLSLTICKVFSNVTATLDPNELNISPHEVEQLLDKIKAKIGVSFEYKERYFLIRGSLKEINDCQLLLQKYLTPDENISDKLGNCSLNVEDVSAGTEDPNVWAAAIKRVWQKDRQERLEEAETLRTCYEKKYSWAKQNGNILDKMISLAQGMSFLLR